MDYEAILYNNPNLPEGVRPFNSKLLAYFTRNIKTMGVELGIYLLVVNEGEFREIGGKTMQAFDYNPQKMAETLGYSERSIYYALANLIELHCISKIEMQNRTSSRKFLVLAEPSNLDEGLLQPTAKNEIHCSALQPSAVDCSTVQPTSDEVFVEKPLSCKAFDRKQDVVEEEVQTHDLKLLNYVNTGNFKACNLDQVIITRTSNYNTSNYNSKNHAKNKTKNQLSLIPETDDEKKRKSGYRSSDYVKGGWREKTRPRTEGQAFVRFFLEQIYTYRGIDYYIPTHKLRKYYTRALAIIEKLDSLDSAKNYIQWYITDDSFAKNAFSFDLMIADTVVERFRASSKGRKLDSSPKGFISSVEDAKNFKGGKIL